MPYVSVTRLRPRSLRFLPAIAFHIWRSRLQIARADGFVAGYLATSPGLALWTVTLWSGRDAMLAFRNTAAHLRAMPLLIKSCDEAAVTGWETDSLAAPEPADVAARMSEGRISKVRHPSPAQATGNPWPDRTVPRRGPRLLPRTRP
jgi:hypothetical protein